MALWRHGLFHPFMSVSIAIIAALVAAAVAAFAVFVLLKARHVATVRALSDRLDFLTSENLAGERVLERRPATDTPTQTPGQTPAAAAATGAPTDPDTFAQALEQLQTDRDEMEREKRKNDEKVKKLWQQSIAIHKEKERINKIKLEIERKHAEILDSVNYARRIQNAILPSVAEIKKDLPDSFVVFKPRDIVSGDFYWFSNRHGKTVLAAVDCTGHGVPGAFMSMIGNTLLSQIVNEKKILDPGAILSELDAAVDVALKQSKEGNESRDGMDIALLVVDVAAGVLQYAGANRPLYRFAAVAGVPELQEFKPDKMPIGGGDLFGNRKVFHTETIALQPGDGYYIFTDGYADQFGGDKGKKLMTGKFKELLGSIALEPMHIQSATINSYFDNWKGDHDQVDDVLVLGIRPI